MEGPADENPVENVQASLTGKPHKRVPDKDSYKVSVKASCKGSGRALRVSGPTCRGVYEAA